MSVNCPYCEKPAVFVDSAEVYSGKSYGMIWLCRDCRAWVGVHRGTDKPLGRLADSTLRRWKRRAHEAFDPIWKDGLIEQMNVPKAKNRSSLRDSAYLWLAFEIRVPPAQCHIGMFDVETCQRVVEVCEKARAACTSDS